MLTWLNHGTREHQIMGTITAKTKYNSTLSDNVSTSKSRTRFVKINLQKCITLKRMHQLTILGQCETMELKNEIHWCYWTIWETYCMFCADESIYPQSSCAYIEPRCLRMGLCFLKPQSWGMQTLFTLAKLWEYRWIKIKWPGTKVCVCMYLTPNSGSTHTHHMWLKLSTAKHCMIIFDSTCPPDAIITRDGSHKHTQHDTAMCPQWLHYLTV